MPHCEDIKHVPIVTLGGLPVDLVGSGLLDVTRMIGLQLFCQHPYSAQTLQHGLSNECQQSVDVSELDLSLTLSVALKGIFSPLCSQSTNLCLLDTSRYCNTSKHSLLNIFRSSSESCQLGNWGNGFTTKSAHTKQP